MSVANYDRKKVRRGMLVAPAAALIGLLPFVLQLNLSFMLFLYMLVAALVVSYTLGLLFGAPGYLLLKRFGLADTKYLMGYAALLVILAPIVLGDIYALVSFAPPVLLAAGAFCFIRGPVIEVPS
jgi:hypothetical protein